MVYQKKKNSVKIAFLYDFRANSIELKKCIVIAFHCSHPIATLTHIEAQQILSYVLLFFFSAE